MKSQAKVIMGVAFCLLWVYGVYFLFARPVPIQLGFVAGLTGRGADLGISGRDGAMLAVEEWNRKGGVDGRPVNLLIRDDKQNEEHARRAVGELIQAGVEAIIGPMTSTMSLATVPLVNQAQLVMMSPTTSADQLKGIDDYFFRVTSTTGDFATRIARHLIEQRGLRRFSVIYDLNNASYAETYYQTFRRAVEESGGQILSVLPFSSGFEGSFMEKSREVLASEPEAVLIVANSMDTVSFCVQFHKLAPKLLLAASEWGVTGKIATLGGGATEGMIFGQLFDREDTSPSYMAFKDRYAARNGELTNAGANSYLAVNVILESLRLKNKGQTLKETLLNQATFAGIQGDLVLDRFGDAQRESYIYTIRSGQFVKAP